MVTIIYLGCFSFPVYAYSFIYYHLIHLLIYCLQKYYYITCTTKLEQ